MKRGTSFQTCSVFQAFAFRDSLLEFQELSVDMSFCPSHYIDIGRCLMFLYNSYIQDDNLKSVQTRVQTNVSFCFRIVRTILKQKETLKFTQNCFEVTTVGEQNWHIEEPSLKKPPGCRSPFQLYLKSNFPFVISLFVIPSSFKLLLCGIILIFGFKN